MADMPKGGAGGINPPGLPGASDGADGIKDVVADKASEANEGQGQEAASQTENVSAQKSSQDASAQQGADSGAAAMDVPGAGGGDPAAALNNPAVQAALSATPAGKAAEAAKAAQALGAAGTSPAAPEGPEAEMEGGSNGGAGKAAAAAAAVPAAGAAGQLMVLAMFINWLKGLMMMMAALMANLWNLILGVVVAVAKVVVGFFATIGAGIASAVGGAISVTAGGFIAAVATIFTIIMGGGAVAAVNQANDLASKDGTVQQCEVASDAKLANLENGTDTAESTKQNAQTVYSVFKAWGMSDNNIAGIIGNWDAESGVDPTSVEGIFDEPQTIGQRKQAVWDAGFNHMAYLHGDPSGIGLGQWTRSRNTNLLAYAKGHNVDWYDIKTQLGFMVSASEGSDANIVKGMIKTSQDSPGEAAMYFHDAWERSGDDADMKVRRVTAADKWYGMFSGWSADKALADSILSQSGSSLDAADANEAASIESSCRQAGENVTVGAMKEGGMNQEEAQKVIDLYLQEGDSFLDARYGGGGPAGCGSDHAMNCVSFSTYFLNKYTTFQQYPQGNGIQTARKLSTMSGLPLSSTPVPYSVASGPGSGPAGHTFVVMGVQGDTVIAAQAGYCRSRGEVVTYSVSWLKANGWVFVDMSNEMLPEDQIKTS